MDQVILRKYGGKMKFDEGVGGLYVRIVIRRLGRGRGQEGFGNAGALQNMIFKISERQAERLNRERKEGLRPDVVFFLDEGRSRRPRSIQSHCQEQSLDKAPGPYRA